MKTLLIAIALIALLIVGAAYASPWGEWLRTPQDTQGLVDRVTALEAENAALRAALLVQLYDKQLKLEANLAGVTAQALAP